MTKLRGTTIQTGLPSVASVYFPRDWGGNLLLHGGSAVVRYRREKIAAFSIMVMLLFARLLFPLAILLYASAVSADQSPFDSIPIASTNSSHIWRHPSSPDHYIEVRDCKLCLGADIWSGFFYSIPDKISIFFIFARAITNPESSPLALWTNGGPGASAVSVAFSKAIGCELQEDFHGMRLLYNANGPKRWNEKMNVVFIEQPVGTGFSRGNGKGAEDTQVHARYIYDFIQVVLARHPHIPDVSLHSLSYGGHFIPEWAIRIVQENDKVIEGKSNNHIIPLKSVTMGNAWFGTDEEYLSRFDLLCETHPYLVGATPFLSPTQCEKVVEYRSMCADFLKQCRRHPCDNCAPAHLWCLKAITTTTQQSGRNIFHVDNFATSGEGWDTYPALTRYLNLRPVQIALGVIGPDDAIPVKWEFYNTRVSDLHTLAGDHVRRTDILLPTIIDAGVDVLIYVGTLDFVCGFRAARAVVSSQNLVEGDIARELKNWKHGSGRFMCSGGESSRKGLGRFCYLEIDGQGHAVALDYDGWPDLLEKWILQGSI